MANGVRIKILRGGTRFIFHGEFAMMGAAPVSIHLSLLYLAIFAHGPDDPLEEQRQDLGGAPLEEEVAAREPPRRVRVRVHDGDGGAPPLRLARVAGGGVDGGGGAHDEHEVDGAPRDPVLDVHEHGRVQGLVEPHHARPQQARLAPRAVREVFSLDLRRRRARVEKGHRLVGGVVLGGRGEGRARRVRQVMARDVAALVEALDVENAAV